MLLNTITKLQPCIERDQQQNCRLTGLLYKTSPLKLSCLIHWNFTGRSIGCLFTKRNWDSSTTTPKWQISCFAFKEHLLKKQKTSPKLIGQIQWNFLGWPPTKIVVIDHHNHNNNKMVTWRTKHWCLNFCSTLRFFQLPQLSSRAIMAPLILKSWLDEELGKSR